MTVSINVDCSLCSASERTVVYRYLDLLAERAASLEKRLELQEISKLREENRQLRSQLSAQAKPDLAQLLVFLPVIYRNFWNTVRPSDLALLAGTLEVPQVPSPYPEPGAETIAHMKRELLNLPEEERTRLADFCRQLPYQLTVRPEMRTVLENKNGG